MSDHRAEAEKWLHRAIRAYDEPRAVPTGTPMQSIDDVRLCALIGIGQALLANLPARYTVTATSPDDRCPWWTNGKGSWALWSESPSVRRCVLYAGHEGDHRDLPSRPKETADA